MNGKCGVGEKLKKELPQQAAKYKAGGKDEEKKAAEDRIHGGKADNEPDSKFPKKELKKGQGHEKEHTDNPEIAKEIAKDHLKEDKSYYEKLDRIEK